MPKKLIIIKTKNRQQVIILNLDLTFKETHCFGKKAKNGAKTIIGGDGIRKEMTEREREREMALFYF
jgi:hypothetical protein